MDVLKVMFKSKFDFIITHNGAGVGEAGVFSVFQSHIHFIDE
jgi:protein tyrosine phosphatase